MVYFAVAVLLTLMLHEIAHGYVAYRCGDPTAKMLGRLTLDPRKHLDPIGTVCLVLFGFGWAKPVGINPSYFRNQKEGLIKVSFAGPGANFFLAFLASFLIAAMNKFGILTEGVYAFLLWTQLYNVWFAFFNLIPIPPLDGSKILMSLLPPKQAYEYLKIEPYSMYILIAMLLTGAVGFILRPFAAAFLNSVSFLLSLIF